MGRRRSSYRKLSLGRLDVGLRGDILADGQVPPGTLRVATNARVIKRELTNAPGWKKLMDPESSLLHIHFDEFPMKSGTTHLITAQVAGVFYWISAAWVDISGAVTFTGASWSSTVFPSDDYFILTNKAEPIQKWDGVAGAVSDLAAAAPKCGVVRVFANHVVALDIDTLPQKVQWTALDDSTNWISGGAGSNFLDDSPDFIIGGEPLGGDLVIYKERAIYLMSYIGPPLYMRFIRREDGIGIVGKDAIANLGNSHIIFCPDNLREFNGLRSKVVGDHFMPDVLNLADPNKLSNAKLFFLEETEEILIMITSTTSSTGYPDLAWRYNYVTGVATGPEELPAAAVGFYREEASPVINDISDIIDTVDELIDSRAFIAAAPINIFSNAETKEIEQMGNFYGRGGADVSMNIEFPVLDLSVMRDGKPTSIPELLKRIKGVAVRFSAAAGDDLLVKVGTSSEPTKSSMTWSGPFTLTPPNNLVTFRARGRYFTLQMSYTGQNKISIEDVRVLVREAGLR